MLHLKVHHIGYLVKKISAAVKAFENLGYTIQNETVRDDFRKVDICFMEKDGYCIELVSPTAPDSVAAGLLKKYKNSPYHICYESADFDNTILALAQEGYTAIDVPTPAPAIENRRVVFFMHASLGMIEVLDSTDLTYCP